MNRAAPPPGPLRAVVFDVGEVLIDETRRWGAAGFVTVFLRRGPWAHLAPPPEVTRAQISIESLADLSGRLAQATS